MTYAEVLALLDNVPYTFRRDGDTTYEAVIAAVASAVALYTESKDDYWTSVNFADATGPMLSVWGMLLGVTRYESEGDAAYRERIGAYFSYAGGTVESISTLLSVAHGLDNRVIEESAGGYRIDFREAISSDVSARVGTSLGYLRPAGVPYAMYAPSGGGAFPLGSINYLGTTYVTGSYFALSVTQLSLNIGVSTNSPVPSIPDTLATDPYLTGQSSL